MSSSIYFNRGRVRVPQATDVKSGAIRHHRSRVKREVETRTRTRTALDTPYVWYQRGH